MKVIGESKKLQCFGPEQLEDLYCPSTEMEETEVWGDSPGFSFEHIRIELPIRYLRGGTPTGFLGLELREDILAGDTVWESSANRRY